jgi:hypothetical protein
VNVDMPDDPFAASARGSSSGRMGSSSRTTMSGREPTSSP